MYEGYNLPKCIKVRIIEPQIKAQKLKSRLRRRGYLVREKTKLLL